MGYGTETFFLGNAVKVGWAVTQRREPPAAAHFTSPFSRPKLEPWGWVMTGIEGHSIAKSACGQCAQWPRIPSARLCKPEVGTSNRNKLLCFWKSPPVSLMIYYKLRQSDFHLLRYSCVIQPI